MRDVATIDSDLRLLSRAWRAARVFSEQLTEQTPTTELIDQLLDERAAATRA
jgi:hypothetical protein